MYIIISFYRSLVRLLNCIRKAYYSDAFVNRVKSYHKLAETIVATREEISHRHFDMTMFLWACTCKVLDSMTEALNFILKGRTDPIIHHSQVESGTNQCNFGIPYGTLPIHKLYTTRLLF